MAKNKPSRRERAPADESIAEKTKMESTAWRAEADSIPRWLPPSLYAVVTIILFREFIFSGEMLYGSDTLALGYMARAFYADMLATGTFPLWNPLLLGGTPFLESLAGGDSLYPTSLFLLFMDTHRALGWKLVIHVFLAGIFMFGWIRALGLSRAAALLSGLAFLLAPFMVTLVFPGHDGKIFVTALTPLLFWMAELSLRKGALRHFALLGLVVAVVLYSTHFQMAYFLFGAVGAYYIFRTIQLWREERTESEGEQGTRAIVRSPALRRLGLFLLASVIGAGAAGVQLLPAFDYIIEFSRRAAMTAEAGEVSRAYSSSWSLHPEEAVSLVVPEFIGNSAGGAPWTTGTYWGRNVFKLNHEYIGVIVLLLAGLSFLGAPSRGVRWFFAGLGGITLLFGLGANTPVWRIFYEVLPGISLFRAPGMVIFLTGFAGMTLMAFGVDRGIEIARSRKAEVEWRRASRYLWGAGGALLLLTLLAVTGILTSLWTTLLYPDIPENRLAALETLTPFMVRGFFIATLLVLATAGALWALRNDWLKPPGVVVLLALIIGIDMARVNEPFIQLQDYRQFATPDQNMRFLMERNAADEPFRVHSLLRGGEDVDPAMHGIELAGGHHPNDLLRYRDLIGGQPERLIQHPNIAGILNVRYLLWPDFQIGSPEGLDPVSRLSFQDGRPYMSVYELPTLPRARLVGEVVVLPDAEALAYLRGRDFDPVGEVVLPEAPPIQLAGGIPAGTVSWEERHPNRQKLQVRSEAPALLVVADNWFPAWKARVNGVETEVLRANYSLRAVPLPAGDHAVEFYYHSSLLRSSLILTLLCLVLLLGTIGGGYLRARRIGRE